MAVRHLGGQRWCLGWAQRAAVPGPRLLRRGPAATWGFNVGAEPTSSCRAPAEGVPFIEPPWRTGCDLAVVAVFEAQTAILATVAEPPAPARGPRAALGSTRSLASCASCWRSSTALSLDAVLGIEGDPVEDGADASRPTCSRRASGCNVSQRWLKGPRVSAPGAQDATRPTRLRQAWQREAPGGPRRAAARGARA